ncbi:MAG: hypothetical protein RLZZ70_716 [Candidatus Parcubacteria bacterium]|jgi:ribose 5-phosphate isomerase B
MESVPTVQFSTIYLGTDHAGFTLKEVIKSWLQKQSVTVIDCGATVFDGEDDFPDYVIPAAKAVTAFGPQAGAVVFGGSGQGEAIAANRLPGIRTTVFYGGDVRIVSLGREHNDANVLSLGARFLTEEEAIAAVATWLSTPAMTAEKYHRRNKKIDHQTKLEKTI